MAFREVPNDAQKLMPVLEIKAHSAGLFRHGAQGVQNLVAISTGVHPFCPPDGFRRVHFCLEKSVLTDVRMRL